MSHGTCDLDDPCHPRQRARDRESQEDQLVGIEAAEARGARGGADHADFKSLDGPAEQHRARRDRHQRNDAANDNPDDRGR